MITSFTVNILKYGQNANEVLEKMKLVSKSRRKFDKSQLVTYAGQNASHMIYINSTFYL